MKIDIKKFIKNYNKIFYALIITLFIEIFICNFGFFRTLFLENKNMQVDYSFSDNKIIISNINSRITSINFEYENELIDKISYDLIYKAEENSDIFKLKPKQLMPTEKQYIHFDTHSKCTEIEVHTFTKNNLKIKNIILNHPNININFIRILYMFVIVLFCIKIKTKEIYIKEYDKNSKKQNFDFVFYLAIILILAMLYTINQFNTDKIFIKKEDINKEDSILMQTEAFANKQIKLMEEPSKELKNMKNPYDNVKRDKEGIPYLYDVAYYKGAYYNYFGIAPIITSILPFRLITGKYMHTYIFNMLYICIAFFSLYALYRKLVNKYINKLSLFNYYLGFYAILFASNIFTLLRGEKYDIVVSSGIAFLILSLNLAMSIYANEKYKYFKLIMLGITTALIVLSKPNLIIYYFLILLFILISMKELSIKEKIKNSLWTVIPIGIFAIMQMILNYVRFENIFEFGAKYQLTGLNMLSCMTITFGKIYAGLLEYFFRTPSINPLKFPFIFVNTDTSLLTINEVCYENRLVGLIGIPILYAYILKRNVLENTNNKELNYFINFSILTSIISILINTCFGGICEAYSIDFKLILSIGAVIILLKWLEINKDEKNKREDLDIIFLILCISTIIIMLPIGLTTERNFLIDNSSNMTVILKNIFEFWA